MGDLILSATAASASQKDVTTALQKSFTKDEIYTRIGSDVIVSVNPFTTLEANSDMTAKVYATGAGKEGSKPAHVFDLAAQTYVDMLRTNESQAIVISGESGSGKTTAYNLILKELATLASKKSKKEHAGETRNVSGKIASKMLKSCIILEAFGSAKTVDNESCSRFGKYMEVQYDTNGKLVGAKLMDYLLEKSRVSHVPNNERNFQIFYTLLSGAPAEDKEALRLLDSSKYAYLNFSKTSRSAVAAETRHYEEVKSAMKSLGFNGKSQRQIFQLLAAILNLGNIEFTQSVDQEGGAAEIKDFDQVRSVSKLLGVRSRDLESVLIYKTKVIKGELCTVYLTEAEANAQRDMLAQALYSLLFSWIVETINTKLAMKGVDNPATFIGVLDMFGYENKGRRGANGFYQFVSNYASEKIRQFVCDRIFEKEMAAYLEEEVNCPEIEYISNASILNLVGNSTSGICSLLEEETNKPKNRGKDSSLLETIVTAHVNDNDFINSGGNSFGVKHLSGDVVYDIDGFVSQNMNAVSGDFINLFRRAGDDGAGSKNSFVSGLFAQDALTTEKAGKKDYIVGGRLSSKGSRHPSRRDGKSEDASEGFTVIAQLHAALDEVFSALSDVKLSYVFCIKSNTNQAPRKFDSRCVMEQVDVADLANVVRMKFAGFKLRMDFKNFVATYGKMAGVSDSGASKDQVQAILKNLGVEGAVGQSKVFLNEQASAEVRVRELKFQKEQKKQRRRERDERRKNRNAGSEVGTTLTADDSEFDGSYYDDADTQVGSEYDYDDNASNAGSEYSIGSVATNATGRGMEDEQKGALDVEEGLDTEEKEEEMSSARKHWLRVTVLLTWWIPTFCLRMNGMKRSDIQQAWREKVALCLIIMLISAVTIFFIAGIGPILCPNINQYSPGELSGYNFDGSEWIAVHGVIYDYSTMKNSHSGGPERIESWAGKDATELFYRTPDVCGLEDDGNPLEYHTWWHSDVSTTMGILNPKSKMFKGYLAYKWDEIETHTQPYDYWVVVDSKVYNMSRYFLSQAGYLGEDASAFIMSQAGADLTEPFASSGEAKAALRCMDKIFMIGVVDTRETAECIFANYVLLASTGVIVAVMVAKFLAALQFGSKRDPEDHDKFVILQVPCYTEGEESLRKTLESVASLKYDDKRKLIFVIADGMIIGSGNDRPTPRIVLDILGVDATVDPESVSYIALGEGNKQHNMAKIYTGLYDCTGHLVPFMVVVKVGKPSERQRPGNRGKRDSQLVLMHFLQKVHYNKPMTPMELEIYHQMKNVIGVEPGLYEFILMVDADTEVEADALNRMVAVMKHDTRIMGLCGETALSNEMDSWVTMIQVYEYYISHHLAKAFESLFGSVTCLPGCFCMYRIRSNNKNVPLLIAPSIVDEYSDNNVDTLHKKNLLSLGEDRYLTTLMMKHFPDMKLCFTADAQCKTNAPDRWPVLLSQRRRWINSTVHNLMELMLLPQLCGFCCFSMRFVAMLDFIATLLMPATFVYLIYLIVQSILANYFPLISLILLAAAYGLQIFIFLIKRQWQHLGWLVIYVLSLPLFTFIIPLYAFWHFDDFSWGNTRIVLGEKNGKKHILDEEPFDPKAIPLKTWESHESENWEKQTAVSQQTSVVLASAPAAMSMVAPSHVTGVPIVVPAMLHTPSYSASNLSNFGAGFPSDEVIVNQIKTILANANLMTVTKRQVRDQLSADFGVDLSPKKDFINSAIESVLQGQM